MKLLEDRIQQDAKVLDGSVLKVDMFLNHQIDVSLLNDIGKEFHRLFSDKPINKIVTIEASGIGIACVAAQYFSVPVVFAKKGKHANIGENVYKSQVYSYTKQETYTIRIAKEYLDSNDHVLIIDDFLANGKAILGLSDIMQQSGAVLEGVGIVIEKGFQDGGKTIRERGINLQSLAIVKSMSEKGIVFG